MDKIYQRGFESLMNAYIQLGGDPQQLLSGIAQGVATEPLSKGEADFFAGYEKQMGESNG